LKMNELSGRCFPCDSGVPHFRKERADRGSRRWPNPLPVLSAVTSEIAEATIGARSKPCAQQRALSRLRR